jgi:hypothetical protein
MTITFTGLHVDSALRSKITEAMAEAVARVHMPPAPAQVAFFDDNGPKNAPGIRCALTVRLPRRPPIRIEHVDVTKRTAFDLAYAALARQLHEEAERLRDVRRRPKKYFAARRLLTPPLAKKA